MTEVELKEIVPEDKRADFDTLITGIRTAANPLTGITDEGFVELLKGNADFTKVHDRSIGNALSKREKTWKEEAEKKQEALFKERYPEETEEQKRLKTVESKLVESEKREKIASLGTMALRLLTEGELPAKLLLNVIGSDEAETTEKYKNAKEIYGAIGQVERDKFLKENGRKIVTEEDHGGKYLTMAEMTEMGPEEQDRNWEKVQDSMRYIESLEK
jgi:hypothetical protein